MKMSFSLEETTLLDYVKHLDRDEAIDNLKKSICSDEHMEGLVKGIIIKLQKMSDEEYKDIDFSHSMKDENYMEE